MSGALSDIEEAEDDEEEGHWEYHRTWVSGARGGPQTRGQGMQSAAGLEEPFTEEFSLEDLMTFDMSDREAFADKVRNGITLDRLHDLLVNPSSLEMLCRPESNILIESRTLLGECGSRGQRTKLAPKVIAQLSDIAEALVAVLGRNFRSRVDAAVRDKMSMAKIGERRADFGWKAQRLLEAYSGSFDAHAALRHDDALAEAEAQAVAMIVDSVSSATAMAGEHSAAPLRLCVVASDTDPPEMDGDLLLHRHGRAWKELQTEVQEEIERICHQNAGLGATWECRDMRVTYPPSVLDYGRVLNAKFKLVVCSERPQMTSRFRKTCLVRWRSA